MAFPAFQPDAFQNDVEGPTPAFQVEATHHGGGAGGRGRFIVTMEDRSYYEALKHWLRQGRHEPMSEAEKLLLERARKRDEREEEIILL